jgi:hypothetical protein
MELALGLWPRADSQAVLQIAEVSCPSVSSAPQADNNAALCRPITVWNMLQQPIMINLGACAKLFLSQLDRRLMSRSGQCVHGQQCVSSLSVTIVIVVEPSIASVHAATPYMARSRRLISCQIALLRCTHKQVDGGKQCLSSGDAMMTSKPLRTLCRASTCSGGRALHVCEFGLR